MHLKDILVLSLQKCSPFSPTHLYLRCVILTTCCYCSVLSSTLKTLTSPRRRFPSHHPNLTLRSYFFYFGSCSLTPVSTSYLPGLLSTNRSRNVRWSPRRPGYTDESCSLRSRLPVHDLHISVWRKSSESFFFYIF